MCPLLVYNNTNEDFETFHANPDVSAKVHVKVLVLPEIKANEMGYFPLQSMQLAIKPP